MKRSAAAALVLVGIAGCRSAELDVDAGSDAASADAAPLGFPLEDGGFLDAIDPKPKGPPDAAPPPIVPCGADAASDADADAGACAIPASFCLDGRWLEYFETKGCVDGTCAFDAKLLSCKGYCADGGCVTWTMTAPAPP